MSRSTWETGRRNHPFAYRTITVYGQPFQNCSAKMILCNSAVRPPPDLPAPATPAPLSRWAACDTGLGCSPFARRYLGNHGCFLFLGLLRCFSSPRSPHTAMYSPHDGAALPAPGCPIRESPGLQLFAPHRRISQLTTPFIDFPCQGIHRTPLIA